MSSSEKINALSDKSREELYSMINGMKTEINELNEENVLLKTELNKYKEKLKKCQSKKRQKSSGSEALDRQTVNKKSFSDRICDDLCEEILQYLSLEDKLKLEGVSKQFQRTVLKKHYELSIETDNRMQYRKINGRYTYNTIQFFIEDIFIDLKSLEVLLKKCPNITSIELNETEEECDYNPVFRLITKYCNNLREIDFGENQINDENIEEFQRKNREKIIFVHHLKDANNYNLFPNIEKLNLLYSGSKEFIPRLNLTKLKNLCLTFDEEEEYTIEKSVDTFPTLTHFYLRSYSENEINILKSLEFISNLKNLKEFTFDSLFKENIKLFCDSLKRIGNKCQKLKSIECDLDISSDYSNLALLLSSFEAFPTLKRLNLTFHCNEDENFDINQMFSFEAFKSLSNITHLTLYFSVSLRFIRIKANILSDIDINLPKLQYLNIITIFDVTPEEVTQMADILSRLSRLQTLKLHFNKRKVYYKEIEVKIREKCRKIRTIDIF